MRIKEVIKEKKLTMKDVAILMGISQPSLSRAISENPTVDTLNRIAAALNVPVVDLFVAPASGNIVCPKCGNSIELSVKSVSNV